MAQADAIKASARELISKLPKEIPEGEWESKKEGNSLLFQLLPLPTNEISILHFNDAIFLSELMEDIKLDTFLKEDQATLAKRGRESVAHVVGELRDYLQHECGEGEALPDNVFHDVML